MTCTIPLLRNADYSVGLAKEGNIIDSRVEAFAIGLQMGMKFAQDAEKDTVSALQAASLPIDGSGVRTGHWRKTGYIY